MHNTHTLVQNVHQTCLFSYIWSWAIVVW